MLPLVRRTRDPHQGLWSPRWLARRHREPGLRGIAHAPRDDGSRAELPRAAVRVRRCRPCPDPGRVDRLLGAVAARRGRRREHREHRVVRRDRSAPTRVRPQPHRRIRPLATAQQGRLQPLSRTACSPTSSRSPSCERCTSRSSVAVSIRPTSAVQAETSGSLIPTEGFPHGQPPPGSALPLQPGHGARRSRALASQPIQEVLP